jgi:hypothetical protein
MMWLCLCILPDGTAEETEWITQDGADQMADETEAFWRRKKKRAACNVGPADARDDVVAIAQVLFDGEAP